MEDKIITVYMYIKFFFYVSCMCIQTVLRDGWSEFNSRKEQW